MWAGIVLLSLIATTRPTTAARPNEAAITQIINDVRFQSGEEAPHCAAINDQVPEGSSVQTGMNSRTELTFVDQALVRLSANTRFNFNKGGRNLDLADGAVLLRVPKGAGEAKISMSAVTAAISGTTVIAEYHPHAYLKFISLEGTARLYLKSRWGESVLVRPGQMLITNPDGKRLPDPVIVDLARLMKTSLLFANFPPLPSQNLIAKESDKQQRAKSKRSLIDTNLVIFGKGIVVSLTNPVQMSAASQTAAVAARPASDAIPSSNDLGTIEMPPKPVVSQSASPTTNRSADVQR